MIPPNLKIVRDDSVLHVVDTLHPLRTTLTLLSWLVAVVLVANEWTADKHSNRAVLHTIGLGVGLVGFIFYRSRRDFEFDKSAQKLTWRRKWVFRTIGGDLPFGDITDAAMEPKKNFLARGKNKIGQLALKTKQGTISVCDYCSTKSQVRCEEVASRIREVLRNPKA